MSIRISVGKMAGNCSEAKKLIEKYKMVEDAFEINHNFGGTNRCIDSSKRNIKKDFSELIIGDVSKHWEVLERKTECMSSRRHGILYNYNNLICSPTHTQTHTRLHRNNLGMHLV